MNSALLQSNSNNDYTRYIKQKWLVLICLVLILFVVTVLSISVGSAGLPLLEILRALFGGGEAESITIVWNVRMPRIITGMGVGFAFALAGCIMQNVLRNPLASASTLGVMQGAAFGASIAIVYFQAGIQISTVAIASITITNPYMVTTFAFLGGMISTVFIIFLSRVRGVTPSAMVLAGVALSAMFAAGIALIQYFADEMQIASIVHWTFGNLGRASQSQTLAIFALNAVALIYFVFNRLNYNAMESGTHTAKSLGVNVDALVLISMTIATLISAVSVAFVGTIGFVGLIAPHIVRRFVGNDYRFLIPCSALMGAIIMIAADLASRTISSPAILPIGALTSFLGAPLFLYMIIREGRGAK
ncbi:MAG: iron ABC transporter permease [Oscillospiraceae bacterium]|nr:iron ABC transporter permease [Oscillospiraceae bacterium]